MISDLAIETHGLTKTFGLMTAVESLDLAVPRGSICGFLGPNGAGKTTTIKLLLGLNRPSAGEVRVLGYDVTRQTVDILARVGYVPETSALYDYYKVQDILRFCRDCYPSWDQPLVDRYLELFQLPRNQKVGKLSKGMKNQLALVAALGARPELLILDEPTDGLDPINKNQFLSAIVDQVAETGQTVFFSSHHLNEVERVADRVGFLVKGRLVCSGELDEIKDSHKKIRAAFDREIPLADLKAEGVLRVSREQGYYLLSVGYNLLGVQDHLTTLGSRQMEVVDLTLEDIFIDYAEGASHV